MNRPWLPILLLILVPLGCRTARMPLPESLTSAERMTVEGRQGLKILEHLRFGSFEATAIRRSWTTGSDLEVLRYEGNKRVQQYTFTLREGTEDRWEVACHAFLRVRTGHLPVVDVEFENRSELECTLQSIEPSGGAASLSLRGEEERPLSGTLTANDLVLQVRGTNRLDGALASETTTGYELREGELAIAAVEVLNEGAVWFSADASEQKSLLAAAAASLLLLEDLRVSL